MVSKGRTPRTNFEQMGMVLPSLHSFLKSPRLIRVTVTMRNSPFFGLCEVCGFLTRFHRTYRKRTTDFSQRLLAIERYSILDRNLAQALQAKWNFSPFFLNLRVNFTETTLRRKDNLVPLFKGAHRLPVASDPYQRDRFSQLANCHGMTVNSLLC